jgi:hypothetical protein
MTEPTSTDPKSPPVSSGTAAANHADSLSVGDTVDYQGTALGSHRGVIDEVKHLFDETGTQLRAFVLRIEGVVERITTSADALSKVADPKATEPVVRGGAPAPGQPLPEIPRSAYADTTVPPAVDTREGHDPADPPNAPFDADPKAV